MSNKFWKKNLVISATVSLLIGVNPLLAAEPSNIDPYVDGNLSLMKCIDKGGLDFGVFWDSVIYNDNLKEGIIEPWNDVLKRNQCHSNDVYGLIKQQDKIRKYIRDAFLTCNTQKLPQYKKAFSKLTAEIYYVRHIVDASMFSKAVDTNRTDLYNKMHEKYVNEDFFTESDFDNFFLQTENKYKNRRSTYIECKKGSWQAVGEKWQEFVKFFTEDAAGLKEAGKSIGVKAMGSDKKVSQNSLADEAKKMKIVELFTTDESFTDYLGSFVQMNINNAKPKESLQEVGDFLSRQQFGSTNTESSSTTTTQRELVAAQSVSDTVFAIDQISLDIKTNFDALYRKSGDENLELFINGLDGRLSGDANDGLIEILNGTFVPLRDMLKMSIRMLDRQCPGSE